MQSLLKKIPYLSSAYRGLKEFSRPIARERVIRQLGSNPYPAAAQAQASITKLDGPWTAEEMAWISAIEHQRTAQLVNHEQLVDGTLGPAGLYDGDKTVATASLASKPKLEALWLFALVCAAKPLRVIELGTNTGISSAYIAAALQINGGESQLLTLDASPYRQRCAQRAHEALGLGRVSYVNGLFTETLQHSLERLGTVDLAFIDGHHLYQPTLDYFELILRHATPETIFVFDDVRWSEGMLKAWTKIQSDSRLGLLVDIDRMGLAVQHKPDLPRLVTGRARLFLD